MRSTCEMIKKQKDDIRAEYKLLRSEMDREEKAKRDAAICKIEDRRKKGNGNIINDRTGQNAVNQIADAAADNQ